MNESSKSSATTNELLKDRLIAEMNATSTGTPEFESAFKFVQLMEQKEKDPDLILLDRAQKELELQRTRAEIKKLEHEIEKEEEKESFFQRHGDALITAGAGILGVALVVAAEQIGNQILNSKALKMPTMKF